MALHRLPPLGSIRAFEAAGRLLSFSRAADELAVTHGAVSHQIKALEGWLGVPLFLRRGKSVALTDQGASTSTRSARRSRPSPRRRGASACTRCCA